MNFLLFGTMGLAFLVCLVPIFASAHPFVIFRHLGHELAATPPDFDPKSPSATSLTAVTGVLGAILSAKVLPAKTSYLPGADAYVYFSVLFVALLGLALVFYFCLGHTLGVYLIADWFVFWGLSGAVVTFDLALRELTEFSLESRLVFGIIVTCGALAVVIERIVGEIATLKTASAPLAAGRTRAQALAAPHWKVK